MRKRKEVRTSTDNCAIMEMKSKTMNSQTETRTRSKRKKRRVMVVHIEHHQQLARQSAMVASPGITRHLKVTKITCNQRLSTILSLFKKENQNRKFTSLTSTAQPLRTRQLQNTYKFRKSCSEICQDKLSTAVDLPNLY